MDRIPYYLLGVGAALAALAWLWFVVRAFRSHKAWGWFMLFPLTFPPTALLFLAFQFRRARAPLGLTLLGGVVVGSALVYAKYEENFRSFGERERVVDGDLHLTLTGWDKADYALLADRPDAVVVQMANPDVTDATLDYLKDMALLKELDLNNTKVTDEGLPILAGLPALRDLRLANTAVTDEGFRKHLADKLSIMNLDLTGTKVASKTVRQWKAAREGRRCLH